MKKNYNAPSVYIKRVSTILMQNTSPNPGGQSQTGGDSGGGYAKGSSVGFLDYGE